MTEDDLTATLPSWGAELERERIATHEAGHAAMLVRHGEVIQSLSCDEMHNHGAHVQGDGTGHFFLMRVSVLTAGCKAVTLEYPDRPTIFWSRGSDADYSQLDEVIENFWQTHRSLGTEHVKRAIHELNEEARRISTSADTVIADPVALERNGLLMQEPTCFELINLSHFIANTLAFSYLMSPGMKAAVAHAKARLLEEGTIADTDSLTLELKELIFNEN